MIHIDHTVFIQIILFLVLWFLLNKLLFRPYLRLLEERERRTEGVKHETATLEDEGERLRAQYEERIAQAEQAGSMAKEGILREAREQRQEVLDQAREEAARTLEEVRQEVLAQIQKERELAASEGAAIAQEMANKILGRRVA